MMEYRIEWCQCPTNYHDPGVLFIEAGTPDDAEQIARNHIERKFRIEWFVIRDVSLSKPTPPGHVKN
jgi:hypothetical protein